MQEKLQSSAHCLPVSRRREPKTGLSPGELTAMRVPSPRLCWSALRDSQSIYPPKLLRTLAALRPGDGVASRRKSALWVYGDLIASSARPHGAPQTGREEIAEGGLLPEEMTETLEMLRGKEKKARDRLFAALVPMLGFSRWGGLAVRGHFSTEKRFSRFCHG